MNSLTIFRFEINNYNGFIFEIIDIEYRSFEGALLSVHFAKDFLCINIFFIHMEIKRPWV
jgi:hypothetical protein